MRAFIIGGNGGGLDNLPSPRYILVHSHSATLDANDLDNRAHAFGPFDSYEALVEFDKRTPDDTCYRFAFPLIGPKQRDMRLIAVARNMGTRAAALMLPPRTPERVAQSPLGDLVREAFEEIARREAKRRKKAKRQKRAEREGTEPG